ncbi:MAG TPA: hypothetical protein VFG51_03935 [Candidatus Saccharimonadia bacterium]|nr:hypothetical protein [Candidatus Saccharimonadia bacterium]
MSVVDELKNYFDQTQGSKGHGALIMAETGISFDTSKITDDEWQQLHEYYILQHGDRGIDVSSLEDFKANFIANLQEVARLSKHYKK